MDGFKIVISQWISFFFSPVEIDTFSIGISAVNVSCLFKHHQVNSAQPLVCLVILPSFTLESEICAQFPSPQFPTSHCNKSVYLLPGWIPHTFVFSLPSCFLLSVLHVHPASWVSQQASF